MTPRQADKIIREAHPVTVHNPTFDETFTALFIRRDKRCLYTADGGIFERDELEIANV